MHEEKANTRPTPGSITHQDQTKPAGAGGPDLDGLASMLEAALQTRDELKGPEDSATVRRLGRLSMLLDSRLNLHANRFSRLKSHQTFAFLTEHPDVTERFLVGARVVDFGCGGLNPLASLAVLRAAGAARCIGIDLDALQTRLALRGLARTAMELMAAPQLYFSGWRIPVEDIRTRLGAIDIAGCEAGSIQSVEAAGIEYLQRPAESTGLPDRSMDAITSNSFLEHVPDPDAVLAEMARISRPGAVGWHGIDGVDHRSYGQDVHPLEFLTIGQRPGLLFGCNRVRPMEFPAMFARHGFRTVKSVIVRSMDIDESLHARMAEPWRTQPKSNLRVLGLRLAIRFEP